MRQFLVFGILGPPLGFLVTMAVTVLLSDRPSPLGLSWIISSETLKMIYAVGLAPALFAAMADRWAMVEGVPRLRRTLLLAAAGYGVYAFFTFVLFFAKPSNLLQFKGSAEVLRLLLFGLMPAVPAVVCSLLCGPAVPPAPDPKVFPSPASPDDL